MVAYFLQVNVCWLLFYGVYYALLSKETFFRLNRMWLITSLMCGLALPFAADYFAVKVVPTTLMVLTLQPFVVTAKGLQQDLVSDTEGVALRVLAFAYGFGGMVLAVRFLAGLGLIFKLFLQSKKEKKEGFTLVYTEGGVPPFSFFNFIFINPDAFEPLDFQQIMQHELTHVQQRHSVDVIFMELINIVFWCSPLVYFYKTSLRNVHEYLADEAVLGTNRLSFRKESVGQYGRLLLRQQQSGVVLSLTSNISNHFFSQLKKRILMMTRNKSKRTALIKYALAAPIFLILTAALASPRTAVLAKTEVLGDKVVASIDNFEKEKVTPLKGLNVNPNADTIPSIIQSTLPIKEGDHFVYIGNFKNGGTITTAELEKVDKLNVVLKYQDKLWEGEIKYFTLVLIQKNQDPIQTIVTGAMSEQGQKVLKMAKEGDMIQFFKVGGRWAGDGATRDLPSLAFKVAAPQYSDSPNYKALSELPFVDEKQIAQMNVESKEEWNTRISVRFKDGHTEYFKGSKKDMEQVFKKENVDAAKVEAEQKALKEQKVKLDDEQKASRQQAQKLADEEKTIKQQKNKTDAEKASNEPIFTVVEENPEFIGGQALLFRWLGENIKYPVKARENGGQGTVYVGFVVETDGAITNVNIKRDVAIIIRDTVTITEINGIKGNKIVERTDYSLGKEAVRVISAMPKWKPGKSNGVPVRVAYTLPIGFRLE